MKNPTARKDARRGYHYHSDYKARAGQIARR